MNETRFSFTRLTFSVEPAKLKRTDEYRYIDLNPPSDPFASTGSQFITSMFSFLLPFESTLPEPRITWEDREDFLVFEVQV